MQEITHKADDGFVLSTCVTTKWGWVRTSIVHVKVIITLTKSLPRLHVDCALCKMGFVKQGIWAKWHHTSDAFDEMVM